MAFVDKFNSTPFQFEKLISPQNFDKDEAVPLMSGKVLVHLPHGYKGPVKQNVQYKSWLAKGTLYLGCTDGLAKFKLEVNLSTLVKVNSEEDLSLIGFQITRNRTPIKFLIDDS